MDPDAVHNAQTEHDHEDKGAAVTDERQRHAGNGKNGDGHADVLEDVRENESGDTNDKEETKLITRAESDKKTGEQQEGECSQQKHAADKPPLLADGGEDVIVVHGGGGEKAELDLSVGCFEPFAG